MEDEHPVDTLRSATEIARRALTLSAVVSVAHGDSREGVGAWLKKESLWAELSPKERAFMSTPEPIKKEAIAFTWHVERLVPLLWAIQKIPDLPALSGQCDPESIKGAVIWPPAGTRDFIESAALRSEEEIEEAYEQTYQAHWRVRDAQLRKLPPPDGLDGEVIFERHWAFNWVIGYFGQAWDDIKADT